MLQPNHVLVQSLNSCVITPFSRKGFNMLYVVFLTKKQIVNIILSLRFKLITNIRDYTYYVCRQCSVVTNTTFLCLTCNTFYSDINGIEERLYKKCWVVDAPSTKPNVLCIGLFTMPVRVNCLVIRKQTLCYSNSMGILHLLTRWVCFLFTCFS